MHARSVVSFKLLIEIICVSCYEIDWNGWLVRTLIGDEMMKTYEVMRKIE